MSAKMDKSWWIVAISVGLPFGVGLAYFLALSFDFWLLVSIILILISLALIIRHNKISLILISLVGLLIGWSRASVVRQEVIVYDQLRGKTVSLSGELFDDPSQTNSGFRVLRLDKIKLGNHQLAGNALVMTRDLQPVKRGDLVTISGKSGDELGGYQATITNAQIQNVINQPSLGLKIRNFFTNNLEKHLTSLQANLASAFLVGKRRELPPDFTTALQVVGLTHLIVASGFHLTTVVRAAKRGFGLWSRRAALVGGLAAIFIFAAITGLSASMWRASLVGLLSLLAWFYGRKFAPWRILLLVFALVAVINPLFLWGDVAFYLSFGAFFGVMIVGPALRQYFWGTTKLSFIKQLLTESVAVQIVTWPLSVLFFGKLSLVMLITNLLVVPVASLLMGLAFLVALLGTVPVLGLSLTWLLQQILNYVIWATNWFSQLSFASIELSLSPLVVVGYYLLFIFSLVYIIRRNRLDADLAEFNVVE